MEREGALALACLLVLCGCGGKSGSRGDADDVEHDLDGDVVQEMECAVDSDCTDGLFCNGEERCESGSCVDGDPVVCDDADPCTEDSCSEDIDDCESEPLDADDDGYAAGQGPGGIDCGGSDCDDGDPGVHPGAPRDCTGDQDLNCNAIADWEEQFDYLGDDVRITDHVQDITHPSVVWNGSGYGVAWSDLRDGNYEIYFAALDPDGAVSGSDVRVTSSGGESSFANITWTGSVYGVSWHDNRDGNFEVYFARLGPDGTRIGPDVRVTDALQASSLPVIAWTGSSWGILWQDNRLAGMRTELYFRLVDADGVPAGSGDTRVTTADSNPSFPTLVWAGSAFGAAWADSRDGNVEVYFASLDVNGGILGSEVRVTNDASSSSTPSIAWTGSEFGLAWVDNRDGNNEIYLARLSAAGSKVTADIRITDFLLSSDSPSLAWAGRDFGLAWVDHRDGVQVYFVRIAADATKRHEDTRVTLEDSTSLLPCLTWTGSGFGFTWADNRHSALRAQVYFNWIGCR